LRLGFLTVDRGSIRGRPACAVPFHWLADQLCAVSAENDGGEASRNDGKKRRGCCDVFHGPAPRAVNGSRTSSRRRNSRARLRRRAQSRSRERQHGRHVSIYKPLTVIRCLPRLARCHWGAAHPRKRRAGFGVKSPTRNGTKCLNSLGPTPLLTGIGATRHRRPPLIGWVTGHGFHSTDETSALQNLNVVTVD
jgi:hypothetical protein